MPGIKKKVDNDKKINGVSQGGWAKSSINVIEYTKFMTKIALISALFAKKLNIISRFFYLSTH